MAKEKFIEMYENNILMKEVILAPFKDVVIQANNLLSFVKYLEEKINNLDTVNPTWEGFFIPLKKAVAHIEFFSVLSQYDKDILAEEYDVINLNKDMKVLNKECNELSEKISSNLMLIKAIKKMLSVEGNIKKVEILKAWLQVFFKSDMTKKDKNNYAKLQKLLINRVDKFESNMREENKSAYIFIPKEQSYKVRGINKDSLEVGRYNAKRLGKDGWIFYYNDVGNTSFLISEVKNRNLRKKIFSHYEKLERGNSSEYNDSVLRDILSIKQQISHLYQKGNYAELVLSNYVINTPKKAYDYLSNIEEQLSPYVKNVKDQMKEKAQADGIKNLQNWDIEYYYNQVLKEKLARNNSEFDNYFEYTTFFNKFKKFLAKEFNLEMKELKCEAFSGKEVYTYQVKDAVKGNEGFFILSPFNNDYKLSPFEVDMCSHGKIGQENLPSIQYISLQLEKGSDKDTMCFYDVLVFLHEFGHALHSFYKDEDDYILGNSLTSWDLIELPSQYLEHFIYDTDFMQKMSCHIETKKRIPKALLLSVIEEHQENKPYEILKDIKRYVAQLWLHENFKTYSKKSPSEIVSEKLGQEGIIYNISQDDYMLYRDHYTDYAPTGYVYLYSAQIAYKLFAMKDLKIKDVFTNVFNSDTMSKVEENLNNIVDINKFEIDSFIKKGLKIKVSGE